MANEIYISKDVELAAREYENRGKRLICDIITSQLLRSEPIVIAPVLIMVALHALEVVADIDKRCFESTLKKEIFSRIEEFYNR